MSGCGQYIIMSGCGQYIIMSGCGQYIIINTCLNILKWVWLLLIDCSIGHILVHTEHQLT